ncbi:type I secretion system permease/ATPase [Amorphus sp. 3PC139-8]|uniref:type I secretion system permease/ATPase n=1 Tax=Amorphus sp. 3PC139-8 TaxID=2735676 RepID=UPI00345D7071
MVRSQKENNELRNALGKCFSIFLPVAIFSFFINMFMFIVPIYMLQIYGRVLTSRSEDTLVVLTVMACVALVAYASLEFIRSRLLVRAGFRFDELLSERIFKAVFRYAVKVPGAATSQALRDINTVREFLTGQGLIAFFDAPWVPVFVAVGFLFHPWLGYISLAGALVIFALAALNEVVTRKHLQSGFQSQIAASDYAEFGVRNADAVYAMGMEDALHGGWSGLKKEALLSQAKASDRSSTIMTLSRFVRTGLQIAVLGVGAYLVLEQQIAPGVMVAASIVMARALAPVEMAVGQWKTFIGARSAYARLKALLEAIPEDEDKIYYPDPKGALTLQNVAVAVPGHRKLVVQGATFSLSPGELLAVIGPSGSGKSTLARAICGIWPAVGGAILLDSVPLAHWRTDQLGAKLGYLPQDVELFDGTIADNIARFTPDAADEDVLNAAKMAGVYELINGLPQGFKTRIGRGGEGLSAGQRQRIGLARALFRVPAVVVLDEPNSNLDSDGEAALRDGLERAKKAGSTIIAITHRTSLLSVADKVLLMRGGTIEAFGPRDEVLTRLRQQNVVQLAAGAKAQQSAASETTQAGAEK